MTHSNEAKTPSSFLSKLKNGIRKRPYTSAAIGLLGIAAVAGGVASQQENKRRRHLEKQLIETQRSKQQTEQEKQQAKQEKQQREQQLRRVEQDVQLAGEGAQLRQELEQIKNPPADPSSNPTEFLQQKLAENFEEKEKFRRQVQNQQQQFQTLRQRLENAEAQEKIDLQQQLEAERQARQRSSRQFQDLSRLVRLRGIRTRDQLPSTTTL